MGKNATLTYDGKGYELPVVFGTEDETAVDISSLRAKSGLITLDSGYANTGACTSKITFIDGEKGILRYRGYPVEELAERSSFVETAYLLIFGELPTATQLADFRRLLGEHEYIGGASPGNPLKACSMSSWVYSCSPSRRRKSARTCCRLSAGFRAMRRRWRSCPR